MRGDLIALKARWNVWELHFSLLNELHGFTHKYVWKILFRLLHTDRKLYLGFLRCLLFLYWGTRHIGARNNVFTYRLMGSALMGSMKMSTECAAAVKKANSWLEIIMKGEHSLNLVLLQHSTPAPDLFWCIGSIILQYVSSDEITGPWTLIA